MEDKSIKIRCRIKEILNNWTRSQDQIDELWKLLDELRDLEP